MAVFFAIFFLVTIVVFAIIASMQKPQKSEMRIDCVAQLCDSMAAYVERLITSAEALSRLLRRVDVDLQAQYVLDNVDTCLSQEVVHKLIELSPFGRWKLTFLVMQDLLKCYHKMGYDLEEQDTPEMLGLVVMMARVVDCGLSDAE